MIELPEPKREYELKLRLLGNEVFAVAFSTISSSNKWVAISTGVIAGTMFLLGVYGEKLISMFI